MIWRKATNFCHSGIVTSLISKSVKSNVSFIKPCIFHSFPRPVKWRDIKPTCKSFLFCFISKVARQRVRSTTEGELVLNSLLDGEGSSLGEMVRSVGKKNSVWSRLEGLLNSGCLTGVWMRCCPGWHLLGLKSFAQFSRSFLSLFDIYDVRIWNRNYFGRNTYPFLLRNVGWMETCF